jgi:hypothetical protein
MDIDIMKPVHYCCALDPPPSVYERDLHDVVIVYTVDMITHHCERLVL